MIRPWVKIELKELRFAFILYGAKEDFLKNCSNESSHVFGFCFCFVRVKLSDESIFKMLFSEVGNKLKIEDFVNFSPLALSRFN